jgi:integrase
MPRETERIYTADDCRDRIKEAGRRCKISTSVPGLHLYIKGPGGAATFPPGDGSGFWTGQFYLAGKWNSRGLGAYPTVSFSDAKREWAKLRVNFLDQDTLPPVRRGRRVLLASSSITTTMARPPAVGKTFAAVLEAWLAANANTWAAKGVTARRGLAKLSLADMDIASIAQGDVLAALKDETPRQHMEKRGWLAALFSYAKAQGWRAGDNPARFDADTRHGLPKVEKSDAHHWAVPWKELPAFYSALPNTDAGRALRFTLLTAVRTGDVESMTWDQIEGENGTSAWNCPQSKTGKPLRVPLSRQAMKLLGTPGKGRVFKLVSNAMLNAAKTVEPQATVHGLRSSFRDWCGENGHARELAEMSLGHKVGSVVERAYARSDLLERRRKVLEQWAAFATGSKK